MAMSINDMGLANHMFKYMNPEELELWRTSYDQYRRKRFFNVGNKNSIKQNEGTATMCDYIAPTLTEDQIIERESELLNKWEELQKEKYSPPYGVLAGPIDTPTPKADLNKVIKESLIDNAVLDLIDKACASSKLENKNRINKVKAVVKAPEFVIEDTDWIQIKGLCEGQYVLCETKLIMESTEGKVLLINVGGVGAIVLKSLDEIKLLADLRTDGYNLGDQRLLTYHLYGVTLNGFELFDYSRRYLRYVVL